MAMRVVQSVRIRTDMQPMMLAHYLANKEGGRPPPGSRATPDGNARQPKPLQPSD